VPTKPLSPGQDHAKVYRARKQIVSIYTPEASLRLHEYSSKTTTDTYTTLGRQWRHTELAIDPPALRNR
jgi:hypothetical protein